MQGKWLAVELRDDIAQYNVFNNIKELCENYENVDSILIDVPIGLPENAEQAKNRPDQSARDYLKVKDRKSSIFNVPFRQMVYVKKEPEFWELNQYLNAKVSKPSFAIIKCLRDADEFLQTYPNWKNKLLESHPECAFQSLNDGNGLDFSKHTKEGAQLRTKILSKYVRNVESIVITAPKKAKEDVLDALALAVTAKIGYKSIPEEPKVDNKGLKMQILIANL